MTEFYRSNREKSGHLGECKGCRRVKEDTYRKTQRAKGLQRARAKRYAERHPDRVRESIRRYNERFPEKQKARKAVQRAVREGRFVKPGHCEGCQGAFRPAELHGHHHDYSKPLEVEWLCRACHEAAHHRVDAIPWSEAA